MNYIRGHWRGDHSLVWSFWVNLAAHAGLAVALFFTVTYAFGAFQSLLVAPLTAEHDPALAIRHPPGTYTLTLSTDGARVILDGDFEIGITAALSALLDQHSDIKGVVLHSNGGRVAAGRGVAQLIKTKGLDTYVFETCKSACTTAFIAGGTRILGANGRLGFHQFSVNAANHVPYIDPEAQQKKELEFYTAQNIQPAFLDKIFRAAHSEIWFPTTDELLASGVVHKIIK